MTFCTGSGLVFDGVPGCGPPAPLTNLILITISA